MSVSVDEVIESGKLIPLSIAVDILQESEPLSEHTFVLDGTDNVKFDLPDDWAGSVVTPTTITECSVDINGSGPIPLTAEALLKMTSSIGLTKDYVMRTPGSLIEPQINWWVQNGDSRGLDEMRLLAKDNVGQAFIKASLATFPNVPVVERVVDKIRSKYPTEDLYVDYKMAHSLERTALRIVIPEYQRVIKSKRHDSGKDDTWSLGVQITNSLMASPTSKLNVSGYLFAWWCTNGAISTHASSGNYNRRVSGQDQAEVLEWVGHSTDAIFADLDHEVDAIESLTQVSLEGEINDVVQDVFRQFKVPRGIHQRIVDNLVDSDDLTGYGLMQAITQAANDVDLTDLVRQSVMQIGGAMPATLTDRCNSCHRMKIS